MLLPQDRESKTPELHTQKKNLDKTKTTGIEKTAKKNKTNSLNVVEEHHDGEKHKTATPDMDDSTLNLALFSASELESIDLIDIDELPVLLLSDNNSNCTSTKNKNISRKPKIKSSFPLQCQKCTYMFNSRSKSNMHGM